ncbi:hypothetical protein GCM10027578_27710 [Spirosoma luteolum]
MVSFDRADLYPAGSHLFDYSAPNDDKTFSILWGCSGGSISVRDKQKNHTGLALFRTLRLTNGTLNYEIAEPVMTVLKAMQADLTAPDRPLGLG